LLYINHKHIKKMESLLSYRYVITFLWWLIWYAFVRRVGASGVRHVVAISYCRSVQIEGLAYKSSDSATSQQRASGQRDVWRAALETRRYRDNAPLGVLSCCR
jgi:hypothetical protein